MKIAKVLAALLSAAAPPAVAGTATIEGPARICGKESSFDLIEGERAFASSGIHVGKMTINTPDGDIVFAEGDAWAPPRRKGDRLTLTSGVHVRRTRRDGEVAYAVYGKPSYSDRERLLIWFSGSALDGDRDDLQILERVQVQPFEQNNCRHSIDYGWHLILGPEQ